MAHLNPSESSLRAHKASAGTSPTEQPSAVSGGDTAQQAATSQSLAPLSFEQPPAPVDSSSQHVAKGTSEGEPSASRDTPDLPETFGRYRIFKKLGQGGMGAVYLAHDTQLERSVALKVPKLSASDGPHVIERFYREARAAATLRHPNICPVYDVGEINGVHYMTMAYIEGHLLSAYIRPGKLAPERQVAGVVRTLALALQEAHSHGILHRDLKPANIILNQRGEPVVMDFGLARRCESDDSQITQHGTVVGTPAYMSPEQARGQADAIGPRADIYSLGVILYELLTSQRPFRGSVMEVLCQVVTGELQPPSALRPGLDSQLETICLKAMARKAEGRYGTMSDVAAALTDYLSAGRHADTPTATDATAAPRRPIPKPKPRRASSGEVLLAGPGQLPGPTPQGAASTEADLGLTPLLSLDALDLAAEETNAQPLPPPIHRLSRQTVSLKANSRQKLIAVTCLASLLGLLVIGAGTAAFLRLRRPAATASVAARQGEASPSATTSAGDVGPRVDNPDGSAGSAETGSASDSPPAVSVGPEDSRPSVPRVEQQSGPEPAGTAKDNVAVEAPGDNRGIDQPAKEAPSLEPVATPQTETSNDGGRTPQRLAVPSAELQRQIGTQIKSLYHPEQATTLAAKADLARKLIDLAAKSADNPNERFVLLRQAAELACDASDADLMLDTLDTLAADFEVAAPNMHAQMLQRLLGSEETPARIMAYLKGSGAVIGRALATDNYEVAMRISEAANRLSERPLGKKEFRQEIRDRHVRTERLYQQNQGVQQARAALIADPGNAEANSVLGRWYCLAKGDWEQGLPYLTAGSDERLSAIAKQEVTGTPDDATAKLALADAWWDFSQKADDHERAALLRHADGWYERAYQGRLSTLAKATVERRQGEIGDLLAKLDPPDLERDAATGPGQRGAVDASIEGSSNLRALFERGIAAGLKGNNFALAQSLFGRCVKLDPHHVPTLNNLALNSLWVGNHRQALQLWKTACETAPSNAEIQHNLGRLLALAKAGQVKLDHSMLVTLGRLHTGEEVSTSSRTTSRRLSRNTGAWIYLPFDGSASGMGNGYEDERCLVCGGNGQVKCPATGCSRGAVSVDGISPVARTATGVVLAQTQMVRVRCAVCRGQGFVPCPGCRGR